MCKLQFSLISLLDCACSCVYSGSPDFQASERLSWQIVKDPTVGGLARTTLSDTCNAPLKQAVRTARETSTAAFLDPASKASKLNLTGIDCWTLALALGGLSLGCSQDQICAQRTNTPSWEWLSLQILIWCGWKCLVSMCVGFETN